MGRQPWLRARESSAGVKSPSGPTSIRTLFGLSPCSAEYSAEHGDRPKSVLMLVGPEGDFTPAELSLARSHGCRPITLGPIILRVETASIYCLSVLSYELLV